METKITENYFLYETNKYFRGNAHQLRLGTFGEKKDPVGAKASVDPEATVAAEHLNGRVKYNTTANIDWNQAKKGDVEVNGGLKFFGVGVKTAVNTTFEKAKDAKLKLMSFSISEGPLTTMLNKDANAARKFLAEEGKDGRIVSEVWLLADGQIIDTFSKASSITVSVGALGQGIDVTANNGSSGGSTITIDEGATFAYKLHKVKDWNKDKTVILNMEADFKGMN